MKSISINNGHSFCAAEDAIAAVGFDLIVASMDDETRESIHNKLAPCSEIEFLTAYLEVAPEDIIIG